MKFLLNCDLPELMSVVSFGFIKQANALVLKIIFFLLKESLTEISLDLIVVFFDVEMFDAKFAFKFLLDAGILRLKDKNLNVDRKQLCKQNNSKLNNKEKSYEKENINKLKTINEEQNSESSCHKIDELSLQNKNSLYFETNLSENEVSFLNLNGNDENETSLDEKEYSKEDEFRDFLLTVEQIIGRLLSGADITMLDNLNCKDGLPKEVIVMLVQWCVEQRKTSTRYIERVGQDWAKQGIFSIAILEDKIKKYDISSKRWQKCRRIFGIAEREPSEKEKEIIRVWFEEFAYDEEIIKEAFEICVNLKGKFIFSYINSILKSWKNNNVNTIAQIKELQSKKAIKKETHDKSKVSYDASEYEKIKIY